MPFYQPLQKQRWMGDFDKVIAVACLAESYSRWHFRHVLPNLQLLAKFGYWVVTKHLFATLINKCKLSYKRITRLRFVFLFIIKVIFSFSLSGFPFPIEYPVPNRYNYQWNKSAKKNKSNSEDCVNYFVRATQSTSLDIGEDRGNKSIGNKSNWGAWNQPKNRSLYWTFFIEDPSKNQDQTNYCNSD